MLIIFSKVTNGRGQLPVALVGENLERVVEKNGEGGRDTGVPFASSGKLGLSTSSVPNLWDNSGMS